MRPRRRAEVGSNMAGKAEQQPDSGLLKAALDTCRRHIGFVILFSACLNLLYLAPSIYMLQVYDRVLSSQNETTLVMLTLMVVGFFAFIGLLEVVRSFSSAFCAF